MSLFTSFINSFKAAPLNTSDFIQDSSFVPWIIATIPITLEISIKIYQGSYGKYYCIHRLGKEEEDPFPIYYDIHFPLNWVFNEEFKQYPCSTSKNFNSDTFTGPNHCSTCRQYGFYNGVFIGYCLNCAYEFENSRGNGLTDVEGVELKEDMVAFDLTYFQKKNSIWNTYLKGVDLKDIGDQHLKEEYEIYKDLPDLISVKEEDEQEEEELKNIDWNERNDSFYYDSEDEVDEERRIKNKLDILEERF